MATAQDIITSASDILFDQANVRWSVAELLRWTNDAQKRIFGYRPDIGAVTESISLSSGVKQDLKALKPLAIRLLEVTRNTNGPGIRITQMENLTAYNPDWTTDTASSTIKHYMFNEATPLTFWVYPPASGASIEVSYMKGPTALTGPGDALEVPDTFFDAVLDYVLYRAMSKDAEAGNLSERALQYRESFRGYFGDKAMVDAVTSPNATNEGGAVPRQTAMPGGR